MVQRSVLLRLLSSAIRPPHLLTSALGLEQLRNLRHLDVAYNLLEGHTELSPLWLLAELRKVRHECLKGLGATFMSESPLWLHVGRLSDLPTLLFCPSALSGR